MKRIITIQHTQSVHHTNGMTGGWGDWALSDLGAAQASRIGENLSKELGDAKYTIYSSDLLRARQTADIVGKHIGMMPIYTDALREINCGAANGIPQHEADKLNTGPMVTIDDVQFPGAESMRDVGNRLAEFLDGILASEDENIMIVSHGVALGIFHILWLGLGVEAVNKCLTWCGSGSVSFMHDAPEFGKRMVTRLGDQSYCRL